MTVADYVAQTLADHGVRHVFMVAGGGAMFLNDAFGRERRIKYICNHHEQACAMAAEGYARMTGRIGVLNVTTGPGGINALTGVYCAWTDSIPLLIVSGQVKRETCLATYDIPGLRQLGEQEADIISMVKPMTKYATMITDPSTVRYHLEKALSVATSGRPGPCWLDVPLDVQASTIDPEGLAGYDDSEDQPRYDLNGLPCVAGEVLGRLRAAARPVILVGKGVRLANAMDAFETAIRRLQIPVVAAWSGIDLIPFDDPLYAGFSAGSGTRAGNFVVQNSDVLLVIGSRLSLRQVTHNWRAFARQAFKIQVDADAAEMSKPTVKPDLAVHCDARVFLDELNLQIETSGWDAGRHVEWLAWCRERVERYPVVLPRHRTLKGRLLNPYSFMEQLFLRLNANDVVVCGNASANAVASQTAKIRRGQRLLCNTGAGSMGYDLPAAIGAAVGREGGRVVCMAGDGSIQMNVQELQTIVHHHLPVKVFVLNNGGYLSIRTTQRKFFGDLVGESRASGVSFPDMVKVAAAYGLPAHRIDGTDFVGRIDEAMSGPGPVLCEVMLDPDHTVEPRSGSRQLPDGRIVSPPLEDMFPFLERDEFLSNMLIPACPSQDGPGIDAIQPSRQGGARHERAGRKAPVPLPLDPR